MKISHAVIGGVALMALALWFFSPVGISITPRPSATSTSTITTAATSTAPKSVPVSPTPKTITRTAPAKAHAPSIQFCPKFSTGFKKGDFDSQPIAGSTGGSIAILQGFLARRYGLEEKVFVDGTFGTSTENYLKRYQKDELLSQTGVLDSATQERMLSYCVKGLVANGVEYPKVNFTLSVGSVTTPIQLHEALVESQGTIANGAFRIELISVTSGSARLRVTGPMIGGLQSHTFSIAKGSQVATQHWPSKLLIELQSLGSGNTVLAIVQQQSN